MRFLKFQKEILLKSVAELPSSWRCSTGVLVLAVFVLFLPGCALVPFPRLPQTKVVYPAHKLHVRYKDFSGVIHVHTYYSQGTSTGSFDEVLSAARKAQVDFVIITDHDTLAWLREKEERLYGNVLMMVGTELSTQAGHLSVFGIKKEIYGRQDPVRVLSEIQKAKAPSFINHAQLKVNPWTNWSLVPSITGMEIFNLAEAIYDDGMLKIGFKSLVYTSDGLMRSYLDRPDALLQLWDKVLTERKFVGIGATDAHQRYRFLGKALDSYETMFRTVQTHALANDLSRQAILGAFQKGHVYVGFDIVKPVRNFIFMGETSKELVIMGDVVKYKADLELRVSLPGQGDIHVLKDGKVWQTAQGSYWESRAEGPGIYRVEVYSHNKLWILSNPIYVR